jgi:SAM-dependent methyltransferase
MEAVREQGIDRLKAAQLDLNHPYFLHYRSLFSDLQKAASLARGRLLDIGCGNKPYENMFTGLVSEYVGCDVVQSSEKKVDILCRATAIPLPDASFDTVLCSQVIEHVADHRGLLREAFRLLRSGGILILSGPLYWPPHEKPYDFFRFTEYGLRYLLDDAGFEVDQIRGNGGKWATCGQVFVHTIQASTRANKPFVIRLINRIFAYLDDRKETSDNPMNYVVSAHKP